MDALNLRHFPFFLGGLVLAVLAIQCSQKKSFQLCDTDSAIVIENSVCLVFEDANQLSDQHNSIETVVRETVEAVNDLMPVDKLRIRVDVNVSRAIPEIGLGGFNPSSNEVIISINPEFPNIEDAVYTELGPVLAHEMHHAIRRRAVGYGNTLLQAAVSEGLADCFSTEVFGIDPPIWSVAVTGDDLQDMIDQAQSIWNNSPYDHQGWFLGTNPDIPRWTGYSIGYALVKEFLDKNPETQPSTLFDEPAQSFAD